MFPHSEPLSHPDTSGAHSFENIEILKSLPKPEHYRSVIIMRSSYGVNDPGAENPRVLASHQEDVASVNLGQKLFLWYRIKPQKVDLIGQKPGISLNFAPVVGVGFLIADFWVLMVVDGRSYVVVDRVEGLLVRKLQVDGKYKFGRLNDRVALDAA